jgi:hypothetical protein
VTRRGRSFPTTAVSRSGVGGALLFSYTVPDAAVAVVAVRLRHTSSGAVVAATVPVLASDPGNPRGRHVRTLTTCPAYSVAVSADERTLIVAAYHEHSVRLFDMAGLLLRSIGGPMPGTDAGALHHPACVCVTVDGSVLVSDSGNNRVQEFTMDGAHVRSFGAGDLSEPWGVAANADIVVGAYPVANWLLASP